MLKWRGGGKPLPAVTLFRPAGRCGEVRGRQDGQRFQRILYSAVPATGSEVRLRDRTVTARKSVGFFTVTGTV